MSYFNSTSKIFIFIFIGILFFQFSILEKQEIFTRILGVWKYESHIYRKVGRYGPNEIDPIKASCLYITKDKIFFKDIKFIDTCFYNELKPKAFFDREDKESSYFLDGPLALKYTEEQLSKFILLDFNCQTNGFGTFYLNSDTLILNSTGGVTFFFTKTMAKPPN